MALRERPEFKIYLVETTQHQDLLADLHQLFKIEPELRLDLNLTLADMAVTNDAEHLAKLASQLLAAATKLLSQEKPDLVMVQGDTLSAAQVALAAWYLGIPVAHIEAGLRSHDISQPYPEELCRRTIDEIASLNFAPTPLAMDNLTKAQGRCYLTGNTVVDALNMMQDSRHPERSEGSPYILVTAHRRENQTKIIPELAKALVRLATDNPHYDFIVIKHANPLANQGFDSVFDQSKPDNIKLLSPIT
jgi:UDP-N-acetylglucosamine 2-epimerase (non-hydrolysing)